MEEGMKKRRDEYGGDNGRNVYDLCKFFAESMYVFGLCNDRQGWKHRQPASVLVPVYTSK
jgi:hypothetical protein